MSGGYLRRPILNYPMDLNYRHHLSSAFVSAFATSFSLIVVTELGDKSFFIAAILSMKHNPLVVLGGSMSALALMTIFSTAVGHLLPSVIDRKYTHWASVVLFAIFGVRLLQEYFSKEPEGENEIEGIEAEVGKKQESTEAVAQEKVTSAGADESDTPQKCQENLEDGPVATTNANSRPQLGFFRSMGARMRRLGLGAAFVQAFSMAFLAEWGDRSQIATIALSASKNVHGVTLGALLGHLISTGIAVLGGKMLALRISTRSVTLAGGVLFLVFAVVGIFVDI